MREYKQYLIMIIALMLSCRGWAQTGILVDKDPRIAKFEPMLLKYLISENEFSDITVKSDIKDYKDRIIVKRRLELYPDLKGSGWLIITFKATSDHGDTYWGILNDKEAYLFFNSLDRGYIAFKSNHHRSLVELIKTYILKYNSDRNE